MNQHFSLRRFGWLLKLDLAENKRMYLLTLALVLGLMLLLMLPILGAREAGTDYMALHMVAFSVSLLLGGSLFSSTAFSAYSSQPRGIATLMVPASRLEKFLVPFLVNLVFMLVFLTVYWGLHYGLVDVVNTRLQIENPKARIFYPVPVLAAQILSYLYVLAVAATLAGSIWFTKNGFIKSAATLLATLVGLWLLNLFLVRSFVSHDVSPLPFQEWGFMDPNMGGRMFSVVYPEPAEGLIWAGLLLVVVGLWYMTYARLQEKEI